MGGNEATKHKTWEWQWVLVTPPNAKKRHWEQGGRDRA